MKVITTFKSHDSGLLYGPTSPIPNYYPCTPPYSPRSPPSPAFFPDDTFKDVSSLKIITQMRFLTLDCLVCKDTGAPLFYRLCDQMGFQTIKKYIAIDGTPIKQENGVEPPKLTVDEMTFLNMFYCHLKTFKEKHEHVVDMALV